MEKKEIELAYLEKVDVTFQTYKKALLDCISQVSDSIKVASAFDSHFQSHIMLLNFLNQQACMCDSFLSKYKRVDESV